MFAQLRNPCVCVVARRPGCVVQSPETSNNNCCLLRFVRTSGVKDDVTNSGSNDKQLMFVRDIMLKLCSIS